MWTLNAEAHRALKVLCEFASSPNGFDTLADVQLRDDMLIASTHYAMATLQVTITDEQPRRDAQIMHAGTGGELERVAVPAQDLSRALTAVKARKGQMTSLIWHHLAQEVAVVRDDDEIRVPARPVTPDSGHLKAEQYLAQGCENCARPQAFDWDILGRFARLAKALYGTNVSMRVLPSSESVHDVSVVEVHRGGDLWHRLGVIMERRV